MLKKRLVGIIILILICGIVLFCSYARVFERFELLTYDLRFKIRPPLKCSPEIAIIEIDNETLNLLGRWPFDRSYHAVLIDVLGSSGAKYVVFDILFAEPSPSDDKLIAATEIYGNVYYPLVLRMSERLISKLGITASDQIDTPLLEGLQEACFGWGHINATVDVDGKWRRVPLVIKYKDEFIPHLALLVAEDYLDLEHDKMQIQSDRVISIGDRKMPMDEQGNFLINYAGTWKDTFKHYSYFDILKSYTQIENQETPTINLDELKDKICFVGLAATGTSDLQPTPLEPLYPMVGTHANIFNSILQNKFIDRLERFPNLAILILISLLSVFLILKRKPLVSLIITLGITIAFIAVAVLLFIFFGQWIDLFYVVVIILSIYVGITLYKFIDEQRVRLIIDKELSIAQNIQRSFLPQGFPKIKNTEISAKLKTAKAVGGDLYDFVDFSEQDSNQVGIFIGDVSGKGMPAALYMALCIAEFRVSSKGNTSAANTLAALNKRLLTQSRTGLFVTTFYMIYNSGNKKLVYSNGGHLPALLYKASEQEVKTITTEKGGLLGLLEGNEFGQGEINLSKDDIVVLYTDGVVESRNTKKEDFGEDRLKGALVTYKDLSADGITQRISEEIINFSGKAPQHDDFTIIALKID